MVVKRGAQWFGVHCAPKVCISCINRMFNRDQLFVFGSFGLIFVWQRTSWGRDIVGSGEVGGRSGSTFIELQRIPMEHHFEHAVLKRVRDM